tara:strand:- start:63 stop:818 length:756 start_codon:yes stop_codon:yes gene_type:complete
MAQIEHIKSGPNVFILKGESGKGNTIGLGYDDSLENKILSLFSDRTAKNAAKFVGDTANLLSDMNINVGKFNEYSNLAKMLSPFALVQMIQDMRHGKEQLSFDIDNKFSFNMVKTVCDTFQVMTYLTCCVAFEKFNHIASVVKHSTSLLQNTLGINKLFEKYLKKEIDVNLFATQLVSKLSDVAFRIIALGLGAVCHHVEILIGLTAVTAFLVEKLVFDSPEKQMALKGADQSNIIAVNMDPQSITSRKKR